MHNKTIIEINGKRYDAKTGDLISEQASAIEDAPASTDRTRQTHHVEHASEATHISVKRTTPHTENHSEAQQTDVRRSAREHTPKTATSVHAQPQKAVTLMRSAVKKPATTATTPLIQPKRSTHTHDSSMPIAVSARSQFSQKPHTSLAQAAAAVPKNHHIKHFTPTNTFTPAAHTVKVHAAVTPRQPHVAHGTSQTGAKTHHFGDITAPSSHTHATARQPQTVHAGVGSHHRSPSREIIEKGLANARSHEQAHHAKPKKTKGGHRRLATISAGVASFVLLAGFIAYQNIPNIAMRVAASRAGFNATMPQSPSGYSLKGPIQYAPGQITFDFASNSSDQNIKVTQRTSNWDSQTLLKNHVKPVTSGDYDTTEAGGRTLYIYDNQVTWVQGGVWYLVEGNEQTSRLQLITLAGTI